MVYMGAYTVCQLLFPCPFLHGNPRLDQPSRCERCVSDGLYVDTPSGGGRKTCILFIAPKTPVYRAYSLIQQPAGLCPGVVFTRMVLEAGLTDEDL